MENVVNVTTFLRKKIIAAGGDPERETLNIILTKDGANYLQDETGDYWRSYVFIDDATCFDLVEKPEDFYNSSCWQIIRQQPCMRRSKTSTIR